MARCGAWGGTGLGCIAGPQGRMPCMAHWELFTRANWQRGSAERGMPLPYKSAGRGGRGGQAVAHHGSAAQGVVWLLATEHRLRHAVPLPACTPYIPWCSRSWVCCFPGLAPVAQMLHMWLRRCAGGPVG